ncbi:hypothetical protein [Acinetobacter johnsonii]|uniref:hypothetical protein n=1 Tax=Acinetobacter johnsonii TaxID=40214 RepID=UPI002D7E2AFF|nr:hypothetical protein [Acinetobacter johnsonii]
MATASLGRLTLDLVTKTGNFTGPMTQAERQAKSSSKNIANSFSVASIAATAFGAAVAGVSIGGMAAFADQTIQTGSEIKKFAQLANTSVRDFQFYAKGAETAGISMESFADKMKDMQDRIGDFQQTGGGPLADFFENIAPLVGVTIQQFQKLSGPEALQLYYDSLQKVGASQNDLKFYMEAIISDSSLLIPLLENGGDGFKKWGDAAERANAIMSDEMIETLALAKENVQLLNLQWDGLKATLVNNVVPVVQLVSDNMDDIKAVALALTAAMAVKLVPTVVATSIQLAQLAAFSVRAGAGLIGLSASASTTTGAMVALRGAMAFLGGPAGLAMLAAQGIAAGAAFLYMKNSSDDVKPALDKQGKSVADLVTEYNNLSDAQQRAFKYQEMVELKGLTESYNKAQQQVRAYASSIAEVVAKDETTKNTIRGWIKEFDNQKISAETLANRINSLTTVGEENKQHMDKHAVAATGAKNSMAAQQKVVESLSTQTVSLTKKSDALTVSTNNQAQAWIALTQKQRAALTGIQNQNARSQYIANNMALGWSREKAEYVADYRDEAGLDYAKRLTKYELIQLENGFKIQRQTKAREDSEKKIAEVKEKQLASQKKMSELVGASALSGLRIKSGESVAGGKVRNYTAEFAKLTQDALGSDLTRFTAFNDLYHKGTNSRHATGNAFDFTVKNAKEATQAVKTLEEMAKRYGFTIKAINEYKTPSGRSTGGHVHVSVLGYKGEAEAIADAKAEVTLVRESMEDMEQVRTEILERQKTVRQQYFNEEEQMHEANKEAIKAIELAYAKGTPERAKYLGLQQAAYQKDVAEYQEAQKQKELSDKKQLLEASRNWMTAGDYAREYYALVREEILNTASYSPEMKNALIKQTNIQQGVEENAEREQVWGDYRSMMGLEESPYQQDMDLLAKARKQMLITEEEYQQQRLAMQMSYGAQYGSDFAGMMMGLVDQSSSAYAILYSVQKGFNLASAIMNGYTAISAAWASAPFPYNLPAVAMATMETGVLQAAISAVSPVGMAHDGIDNIPKEGTWLLDGGERVLNPNQNKDLTNYLSQAQSNGGQQSQVNLNPNFVIVDERESLSDYLFSPDGTKAFVKFFKRNKTALGV